MQSNLVNAGITIWEISGTKLCKHIQTLCKHFSFSSGTSIQRSWFPHGDFNLFKLPSHLTYLEKNTDKKIKSMKYQAEDTGRLNFNTM